RDWLALRFTSCQLYFGLNPLAPEELTGCFVDVDAPAALVALWRSWMKFAAVARLAARKAFDTKWAEWVQALDGTVTDESRNGWSVKRASDMSGDFGTINTFHVLVRGDTVIMLMSGLSYEGSARWADVITQVDSKLSMARLPGMRKAAERLGTDRD